MKKSVVTAGALALVLFSVLAGTGAASAYWSSQAAVTSTVGSGTIDISQAGFSRSDAVYSPTALVNTASITVTNSGTISAPFALTLGTTSSNAIARAISVTTWSVAAAASCVAAATTPPAAIAYTWTTAPGLTGSLRPGGTAIYCIRTSLAATDLAANQGDSMSPTFSLTSTVGSWTAAATPVTVTQRVARDTIAPIPPTGLTSSATTSTQTTLAWAASTDDYGVAAYDIYRNGVLVGSSSSTGFTDTGLTAATTYSYTIVARDAAGNGSAGSTSLSVTTSFVDSSRWYKVVNPNSGLCITAQNSGVTDGTPLEINACVKKKNGPAWQFVSTSDGYYSVVLRGASGLGWAIDMATAPAGGMTDFTRAQLWTYGGGANQQWQLVSEGGAEFHFINRNSGKCLDVNGQSTNAGTALQQYTCSATATQTFSITAVG